LKEASFFIEKTKGNYNNIYNETNFLNTDIVIDMPNKFSSFFIDLRDIQTNTNIEMDKPKIIELFMNHLEDSSVSTTQLKKFIYPTSNIQYKVGI
jgi:putative protease